MIQVSIEINGWIHQCLAILLGMEHIVYCCDLFYLLFFLANKPLGSKMSCDVCARYSVLGSIATDVRKSSVFCSVLQLSLDSITMISFLVSLLPYSVSRVLPLNGYGISCAFFV